MIKTIYQNNIWIEFIQDYFKWDTKQICGYTFCWVNGRWLGNPTRDRMFIAGDIDSFVEKLPNENIEFNSFIRPVQCNYTAEMTRSYINLTEFNYEDLPKDTRYEIRKGEKIVEYVTYDNWEVRIEKNYVVRLANSPQDLKEWHKIMCMKRKQLGSLCYPLSFFQKMLDNEINTYADLYVMEERQDTGTGIVNHRIVGGLLTIADDNVLIDGYSATIPGIKHIPSKLIYEVIMMNREYFDYFDFGCDPNECENLLKFKKSFGTIQEPVYTLSIGVTRNSKTIVDGWKKRVLQAMPLWWHQHIGGKFIKWLI